MKETKFTIRLTGFYLVMLAFCLAPPGFANQKTDSLYQIVNSSQNDSLRVIALLSVSQELKNDYPDSAMIMLDFAKKLNTGKYKNFLDALILNEKAMLFYKVAKYPEALELFYQAKNLIETNEDGVADSIVAKNYLANLNSIGVIFFETGKFTEAIENFKSVLDYYNKKVITIASLRKENFLFKSNLNLGAVYLQLREFKKAEVYSTLAIQFLDKDDYSAYGSLLNNLSIIARETGDLKKAFELNQKAIDIYLEKDHKRGLVQAYNNLGHCFITENNKEKALEFYKKAFEISKENNILTSGVISLQMLADVNSQLGNYKTAFEFQKLYKDWSDSLLNLEKIRLITQLELQDKFEKRLLESRIEKEKNESEQKRRELIYSLIIILATMGLIILVLLFYLQKNKAGRLRLEAEKSKLEQKSLEVEKHKLEEELEFKNKELATNVMYMVQKNELINNVSEKLIKSKLAFKKENQVIIEEIIRELQSTSEDSVWTEFEIRFQQVHNEFYNKLNERIPTLSANEKKLCAFLRLNMSTKEISAITYQSVNSITVARSRLRKKIGLETDESLISFLESI